MKTLKTLFLTIIFASFGLAAFSNAYNETRYAVENTNDLKVTIKKMVTNDFSDVNNYFHQNGIENLDEAVVVKFYINKENKIQVVDVEGTDEQAKSYVKQLLNNKMIKTGETLTNKYYKLAIKLDYRS